MRQFERRNRTSDYRRFQDKKHKKRLRELSKHAPCFYMVGDKDDWYWNRDYKSPYVKRISLSSRKGTAKKYTNRKIRHYTGDLKHPSDYQKLFDFWWSVW